MRTGASGLLLMTLAIAGGWPEADRPEAPDQSGVRELQARLDQTMHRAPDQSTRAYRTNVPYAALQLRKAQMLAAGAWGMGGITARDCVSRGLEALKRYERGEAMYAEKGTLTELAYFAANDGTAQPYYLHLPAIYDPTRPWPLIIFLHGYVPTTSILDPWLVDEEVCQVAEDNGCMLLVPYGRRNTDFQGVGEVDVLAATEEVKALYNVDPSRIYMSGVSMGGMGAWTMALRHPGMYAATTPISGQTDMHTWWPRILPQWPASRDQIPPFRRFLVEWDNPIDLVANARNQPMFVQHGELDTLIPVEQSRSMVAAAAALGIRIELYEFKGASHYIYWDLPCFRKAWSWATQFSLNPSPAHVTYKTYSLEYDQAFWLQIADFVTWGEPATVDCQVVDEGHTLRVETANVRLLNVDLSRAPLAAAGEVQVVVNGRTAPTNLLSPRCLQITCDPTAVEQPAWPPRKRKGLCGPVEEVFDGPFLVVVGTSGSAKSNEQVAANAQRWAEEWDRFADGAPRVKTDAQLTEEDIAGYNLVLFGDQGTNAVLARIAHQLPLGIGDHSYTVAGKTFRGKDLGLVMCYPNPLAPEHYVAIYAGELYGQKCGINHKHDLIPDFIVFNTRHFNYDDTNEHEVAGYFDMNWRLNEKSTWVREADG